MLQNNGREDQVVGVALGLILIFAALDIIVASRRPVAHTASVANDLVLVALGVAAINRVRHAHIALGTMALVEGGWLTGTTAFVLLTGRTYFFGTGLVVKYLVTGILGGSAGGFLLFSQRARRYFSTPRGG